MRLAEIFTDHMILQRNQEIRIFGTLEPAEEKEEIYVELDGEEQAAEKKQGKWEAVFSERKEGGPYTLKVRGKDSLLEREDIYFGEVWVAAGQSNMAMPLAICSGGEEELKNQKKGILRYYIQAGIADEGGIEQSVVWKECVSGTFGDFSGVAYYCGQELSQRLNVPIGIIVCAHPGTAITCWMDLNVKTPSKETAAERERAYRCFWKEKREGSTAWPPPIWEKSPFWPGNLYRTMVMKIAPYSIRGVLYYQGEEDAPFPEGYSEKLKIMICEWRNLWRNEELPFILAQLPVYDGKEQKPDSWPMIRKQQEETAAEMDGVEMIVLIDCGEKDNIHPGNKKIPGVRFARKALKNIYDMQIPAEGPEFADAFQNENGAVTVHFKGGNGQIRYLSEPMEKENFDFELAGKDGCFFPASVYTRNDKIELRSNDVPMPLEIRYAWHNYGKATLFDEAGFPVAPFRSKIIGKECI